MKKALRFLLSLAVVLTVMTWTAGPASAAPTYNSQMLELNRHVNAYWMGQFIHNRNNRWALGLGYMDWSTDGCSVVGSGPYDFYKPCLRHDFGYRNLKRIENTFGRDVWKWRNKANVDTIFGIDMDNRCREHSWWVRGNCYVYSDSYEGGVRIGGGGWPSWPTQGAYYYSLSW